MLYLYLFAQLILPCFIYPMIYLLEFRSIPSASISHRLSTIILMYSMHLCIHLYICPSLPHGHLAVFFGFPWRLAALARAAAFASLLFTMPLLAAFARCLSCSRFLYICWLIFFGIFIYCI
jgi:hypothetical protein